MNGFIVLVASATLGASGGWVEVTKSVAGAAVSHSPEAGPSAPIVGAVQLRAEQLGAETSPSAVQGDGVGGDVSLTTALAQNTQTPGVTGRFQGYGVGDNRYAAPTVATPRGSTYPPPTTAPPQPNGWSSAAGASTSSPTVSATVGSSPNSSTSSILVRGAAGTVLPRGYQVPDSHETSLRASEVLDEAPRPELTTVATVPAVRPPLGMSPTGTLDANRYQPPVAAPTTTRPPAYGRPDLSPPPRIAAAPPAATLPVPPAIGSAYPTPGTAAAYPPVAQPVAPQYSTAPLPPAATGIPAAYPPNSAYPPPTNVQQYQPPAPVADPYRIAQAPPATTSRGDMLAGQPLREVGNNVRSRPSTRAAETGGSGTESGDTQTGESTGSTAGTSEVPEFAAAGSERWPWVVFTLLVSLGGNAFLLWTLHGFRMRYTGLVDRLREVGANATWV